MGELQRDIRRIRRLLCEGRREDALRDAVLVLSVVSTGKRLLESENQYRGSRYEELVRLLEGVVEGLGGEGADIRVLESSPADVRGVGVRVEWLEQELERSEPLLHELRVDLILGDG